MNKLIGILLIVLSLGLGYTGVTKVTNSGGSVEVVGVEISASDEGKKTEGFIYIGLAVISFFGGVTLIGKKPS